MIKQTTRQSNKAVSFPTKIELLQVGLEPTTLCTAHTCTVYMYTCLSPFLQVRFIRMNMPLKNLSIKENRQNMNMKMSKKNTELY